MSKRPITPPQGMTRRQTSRAKREALLQRWILIGTGILAAAAIGVLVYGVVDQRYLKPNHVLVTVNSDTITVTQFQNQVKVDDFMQFQGVVPLSSYGLDAQSYAKLTLDAMTDDLVIAQKAKEMGIVASDQDIQRQVQLAFGYDAGTPEPTPTPTATDIPTVAGTPTSTSTFVFTLTPQPTSTLEPGLTPTPTTTQTPTSSGTAIQTQTPTITLTPTVGPTATPLTAAAYSQALDNYLTQIADATGVPLDQVKTAWFNRVRADLLRKKLIDALHIQADTQKTMLHAAHILVGTQDEAKKILDRIKAGESFETLAAQLSTDKASSYKGGDLGWFGPGALVQPFEDAALKVTVGQVSDPVQTRFGWHLIKVYDRAQEPMTASEQAQQVQTKFDDMLQQWRTASKIVTDDTWTQYVPPIQ